MFSYSREFWYRINLYVFLGVEVSRTVRNESADFRFVRKYVSIISNISKIVKNKKLLCDFKDQNYKNKELKFVFKKINYL